mmetsp:Transcript_17135/g.41071  ORF Transcript_17135/g.41071 Transcript_17135/m.41071 type:complete len:207 (+) Transcript_17135:235-855(+)
MVVHAHPRQDVLRKLEPGRHSQLLPDVPHGRHAEVRPRELLPRIQIARPRRGMGMDPVLAKVSSPSLARIILFHPLGKLPVPHGRERIDQFGDVIAPCQPHVPRRVRMGQRRHSRRADIARIRQPGTFRREGATGDEVSQSVVVLCRSIRTLRMQIYNLRILVVSRFAVFPESVQRQIFPARFAMLADVKRNVMRAQGWSCWCSQR